MAALTPEEIGQIIEQFLHTVGTRQYIGARYVPIFGRRGEDSIEWDNTAPYEPLTIVLYQGDSYTSRQYVPTGIEITNQDFWAQTGNYNAQIQAYIAQVLQYDGRITDAENAVEELSTQMEDSVTELSKQIAESVGTLQIAQFNGIYTSTICYNDTAAIVFESAGINSLNEGTGDGALLDAFITRHIGTRMLDAFVTTHFHNDHAGFPDAVCKHCGPDTDILMQMPVTSADVGTVDYNQYTTNLQALRDACEEYGLQQPVTPEDGATYTYGNVTMSVWNTNDANKVVYRASKANNGYANESFTSLNNYSLICRCQCGASSYVETGDVEGAAQRIYAPMMQPCTIARNPHHFYNRLGWEGFYDRLCPKMWLISDHADPTIGDIDVGRYQLSYIYRYLLFNMDTTNIVTNIDSDVELSLVQNAIVNVQGFLVDKDHDSDGQTIGVHPIGSMLPPQMYGLPTTLQPEGDGNPYWMEDLEITDLWTIKRGMVQNSQLEFILPTTMSANYTANFKFRKQCDWLYRPYNSEGSNIIITFVDNPTLHIHSAGLAANNIEFMAAAENSPFVEGTIETYTDGSGNSSWRYGDGTSWAGLAQTRRYDLGAIKTNAESGGVAYGSWTTNDTLDNANIRNGTILVARLSNNMYVPLVRATAVGQEQFDANGNMTSRFSVNGIFRGLEFANDLRSFYHITVNNQGVVIAKQVPLSGETPTNLTIVQFSRLM